MKAKMVNCLLHVSAEEIVSIYPNAFNDDSSEISFS
jgi:hypothetical protein